MYCSSRIYSIIHKTRKAGFREGTLVLSLKLGVIVFNDPIQKHQHGKVGVHLSWYSRSILILQETGSMIEMIGRFLRGALI
jgi:hypothetical protein